jgi:4-amino-4-deoxy-L-arabinose transferase-like glycosyltransferase
LRVPHLCFFLAGAVLIYGLLRSITGKSAAIFGALCWIRMPVVAPKFINSEPDIVLSTLLFAAFCVWWQGTSGKSMTPARWLCISALIVLAGLTKGPQPVAYFTLGVGAYILLKQRDQIPAFIVANLSAGLMIAGWYAMVYQSNDIELWKAHSRLSNTTTGLETGSRPSGFRQELGCRIFARNNPDRTGDYDRRAHVEKYSARPDACRDPLLCSVHIGSCVLARRRGRAPRYAGNDDVSRSLRTDV